MCMLKELESAMTKRDSAITALREQLAAAIADRDTAVECANRSCTADATAEARLREAEARAAAAGEERDELRRELLASRERATELREAHAVEMQVWFAGELSPQHVTNG